MWRDKNEAVFVLALVRRTDKHCQQELLDKFDLVLKTFKQLQNIDKYFSTSTKNQARR